MDTMTTAEFKNEQMKLACPELASPFAAYPMDREAWLSTEGSGPNGQPAFVGGPFAGPKEHYVYGQPRSKEKVSGYYHLLTREAYSILFKRVSSEAPVACCCFGDAKLADAYDTTKTICWNRNVSSRPNDALAAKEALAIAKKIANNTYNWTQNEQLVIYAFRLAT